MVRPRLGVVLIALVLPSSALAQSNDAPVTAATRPLEVTAGQPPAPPSPPQGDVTASGRASLVLSGYVESFWQWNFNAPSNGVTAWRGFDNRHNSFSISNAVIDASWRYRAVQGRLALQVGLTPDTYYRAEPSRSLVPGAGVSNVDLWKYIQQANIGLRVPRVEGLLVEAGIFLSPIGPESVAVRDNWSWSRSNLFYALPYYHTGIRATYARSDRHAVTLMVSNGWNSVVDNNDAKSVMLQYAFTPSADTIVNVLYFGGIERGDDDPAGPAWRHLFDAYARTRVGRRLSLMAHVNAGFEETRAGTLSWFGVAGYARFELTRTMRLAARADLLYEDSPDGRMRVFFPTDTMASQTLTYEWQPVDHLLVRAEYRHDVSGTAAFYDSTTNVGATTPPFASRSQDTLTLGATAWF